MSGFDERKKGQEAKFAFDAEKKFRARAQVKHRCQGRLVLAACGRDRDVELPETFIAGVGQLIVPGGAAGGSERLFPQAQARYSRLGHGATLAELFALRRGTGPASVPAQNAGAGAGLYL